MARTHAVERDKYGDYYLLVNRLNELTVTQKPLFCYHTVWYRAISFKKIFPDIHICATKDGCVEQEVLRISKDHPSLGNIVMQVLMYSKEREDVVRIMNGEIDL